jgi:hypothetical protein
MTVYTQVPTSEQQCFLEGMGECVGRVERGICEAHATLIFKIAWR